MEYKLVIHINEFEKFGMLFSNVHNFKKDLKDKPYKLVIVMNASAVLAVKDEALVNEMIKYTKDNVKFKVCNNSLIGRKIPRSEVIQLIEVVDTSVVELTRLQIEEKFAYIKL